eukprot:CAMPEP_0117611014 /NCGR_PEP_ID=MMETSP0784-20121206/82174_1 /TAXON_ID=39447 /ORGANISM="" /LENGTH=46 /DNA_ID= /DNA_START= /DNA_END= /DNA_ORIENTATION=
MPRVRLVQACSKPSEAQPGWRKSAAPRCTGVQANEPSLPSMKSAAG